MQIVDGVESEDDDVGHDDDGSECTTWCANGAADVDKTMRFHHFHPVVEQRMLNNVKLPKILHIPRHHNIDGNNFANAFIYFFRDFNTFFSFSESFQTAKV